jgi:hypothetical protein
MKVENKNGTVTDVIGFINIGTMAIPRAQLARVLPDIDRFERCLPLALKVDEYMTEHQGAIPPWLDRTQRDDVAETLREIGRLELDAADELESEKQ